MKRCLSSSPVEKALILPMATAEIGEGRADVDRSWNVHPKLIAPAGASPRMRSLVRALNEAADERARIEEVMREDQIRAREALPDWPEELSVYHEDILAGRFNARSHRMLRLYAVCDRHQTTFTETAEWLRKNGKGELADIAAAYEKVEERILSKFGIDDDSPEHEAAMEAFSAAESAIMHFTPTNLADLQVKAHLMLHEIRCDGGCSDAFPEILAQDIIELAAANASAAVKSRRVSGKQVDGGAHASA